MFHKVKQIPIRHENASTHEAHIREELREYPDTRTRHDDGDDVEYQANNSDRKEQTDESQHANAEIPDTQTHNRWPEREHNTSKHDGNH